MSPPAAHVHNAHAQGGGDIRVVMPLGAANCSKRCTGIWLEERPIKGDHRSHMTRAISYKQIRHEARLLFTLLDARDSDGRMTGTPFHSPWRDLKSHLNSGASYEAEAEKFYELLDQIARSGATRGTWMEQRWLATESRIRASA